eukprot:394097-Pleurochrysis_carterae.AAC.3
MLNSDCPASLICPSTPAWSWPDVHGLFRGASCCSMLFARWWLRSSCISFARSSVTLTFARFSMILVCVALTCSNAGHMRSFACAMRHTGMLRKEWAASQPRPSTARTPRLQKIHARATHVLRARTRCLADCHSRVTPTACFKKGADEYD